MTVHAARQLIDDGDAPAMARIEASFVLSSTDEATVSDLVRCLRCEGVIAELAAAGLYRRTGRPKPKRVLDFANRDLWEQYLIRRRLEAEAR